MTLRRWFSLNSCQDNQCKQFTNVKKLQVKNETSKLRCPPRLSRQSRVHPRSLNVNATRYARCGKIPWQTCRTLIRPPSWIIIRGQVWLISLKVLSLWKRRSILMEFCSEMFRLSIKTLLPFKPTKWTTYDKAHHHLYKLQQSRIKSKIRCFYLDHESLTMTRHLRPTDSALALL